MSRRRLVLAGLIVALLAALGIGAWQWMQRAPTPFLTLPDGSRYRFAGVTYGTNHVMEPDWSAALRKIPEPVGLTIRRLFGGKAQYPSRRSQEPSLVVWFEPVNAGSGTPPPVTVQAMLADEHGVVSGHEQHVSMWSGAGLPPALDNQFYVWPRRSRTLECVVFQRSYGQGGSAHREVGRFRFRNPAYDKFPVWQAEPLPITKSAGDLKVTLHEFFTGRLSESRKRNGYYSYRSEESGEERPRAIVRLTVDSPRGTNESWTVAKFYLKDPTGNNFKAGGWSSNVQRPANFSPVLWPDEPAWKFAAHLKRVKGIPESDLVVFRDVPLPPAGEKGTLNLTNSVNQIVCVLETISLRPPITKGSYSSSDLTSVRLSHTQLPEDVTVNLVSVTFDDPALKAQDAGAGWSSTYYEASFMTFPTNQTRATFTYAVQKSRIVEYLVPPNWVSSTNEIEIKVEAD